jgi:hypothetical protein
MRYEINESEEKKSMRDNPQWQSVEADIELSS